MPPAPLCLLQGPPPWVCGITSTPPPATPHPACQVQGAVCVHRDSRPSSLPHHLLASHLLPSLAQEISSM